jgi:Carboxypeptidase regulatory-like domain
MRRQALFILIGIALMATSAFFAKPPTNTNKGQELLLQSNPPEINSGTGAVEGRVLNADGQSIAGAKIFAERADVLQSRLRSSYSDKDGNYRIEIGEPGLYTIYGSKEEDGYPLNVSGFHRESSILIPKVTVTQNQVVKGVNINLGSKASALEGVIIDATTSLPISKVTITLRRADNPEMLYRIGAAEEKKGGKFKVLVPHVPFTIEVSAPGYETRTYNADGAGNLLESLSLNPGETKRLNITLRRRKQPQ